MYRWNRRDRFYVRWTARNKSSTQCPICYDTIEFDAQVAMCRPFEDEDWSHWWRVHPSCVATHPKYILNNRDSGTAKEMLRASRLWPHLNVEYDQDSGRYEWKYLPIEFKETHEFV